MISGLSCFFIIHFVNVSYVDSTQQPFSDDKNYEYSEVNKIPDVNVNSPHRASRKILNSFLVHVPNLCSTKIFNLRMIRNFRKKLVF